MNAIHALQSPDPSGVQRDPVAGLSRSDEADLVRRARDEPDAFAALYRRHYPAIQRYLRRRLGDPHVVEDAAAETFMSALQRIDRYVDRGLPFRSWLYRIATGKAARHRRRAARMVMTRLEEDPSNENAPEPDSIELARAALLQIAPRYQAVLALHYVEGLSVAEVAQALNCRAGTVKSRLSRGREALRLQLQRMGTDS